MNILKIVVLSLKNNLFLTFLLMIGLFSCTNPKDKTKDSKDSLKNISDNLPNDSIKVSTDTIKVVIGEDTTKTFYNNVGDSLLVEEAEFRIRFPFPPIREEDKDDKSVEYIISDQKGTQNYALIYKDFSKEEIGESPDKFLDKARLGMIGKFRGYKEINLNTEIDQSGFKGYAIRAGNKAKGYFAYRIFLIKNRLYQIFIVDMSRYPTERETDKFIGTFEIKTKK